MRLLFAGTPEVATVSLRALLASQHEVVAVLTRPDALVGRRRGLTPSPVSVAAEKARIATWKPTSLRTAEAADRLRSLEVDAVAVVAYGALVPEALLAAVPHGWINLHFSLLPAWRGAAPVQAAIRAGDDITGASTFQIEKHLDTGPVFGTVTEEIRPRDTTGDLLGRLSDSGATLLVATMDGVASGALNPAAQRADGVSYAGKISTADAHIDVTAPAFAIDRLVRSVTPAPGAWIESRWGRLGIGPVTPVANADMTLLPGELHAGKRDVLLGTGSEPVLLSTVRPAGKNDAPAADWARGARPQPGERLGMAGHDGSAASAISDVTT